MTAEGQAQDGMATPRVPPSHAAFAGLARLARLRRIAVVPLSRFSGDGASFAPGQMEPRKLGENFDGGTSFPPILGQLPLGAMFTNDRAVVAMRKREVLECSIQP